MNRSTIIDFLNGHAHLGRLTIIILKTLTWPLALLVYGAVTNTLGADPTAKITFTTGYTTLLLLDSLASGYTNS
jgi:DMSO/TMAO reductase YedYZ heme-binding membrane subunit